MGLLGAGGSVLREKHRHAEPGGIRR
jgi:hypothetical protein